MSSIRNSVQLIGHLGKEPEIRELQSGTKVGQVSIATSDTFKDKNGELQQRTLWHNLVAWDSRAHFLEKYLHKGSYTGVRGKLSHRTYQGSDGQQKRWTEVIVDEFVNLTPKEKSLPF